MSQASLLSFLESSTGTVVVPGTQTSFSTQTGALTIAGGIGVVGGGYFGGTVTATTFVGAFSGTISGNATSATNLSGGNAWQIPYQSAPSTTLFASSGTTGQFWQATTNGAPAWTTTANIYVANAQIATHQRGGTAGQLHYQSAADTTAFVSTATTGNFLQANYVGAPTWTTTANIYVANAVTANNLAGGSAGQFAYQTGAGATSFMSTGSMYVGNSAKVDTVAQTANANYYPTLVDSNNAAAGTESVYTTSSFYVNPSTGALTAATITASSNAYNTATAASNAIYTSGGIYAGAGLTVAGPTLFKDLVTFSGTATYVYSTQTVYTDNLIELHTPSTGVNTPWFVDDGKDIGIRMHYYTNSTDTNAALILANDTKY